jgi:hypothetical protein
VAKLVARLLATAALWVRSQTSPQKTQMGDISKGVTNTLWYAKKYTKTKKYSQLTAEICSKIFFSKIHTTNLKDFRCLGFFVEAH